MCECLGYFEDQANICRGCEAWRKKHRYPLGKPCGGDIGRLATSMGRDLCYYCNEALMKFEKARAGTQTPPRGQGAHSSPPQSPPPRAPPPPPRAPPPPADPRTWTRAVDPASGYAYRYDANGNSVWEHELPAAPPAAAQPIPPQNRGMSKRAARYSESSSSESSSESDSDSSDDDCCECFRSRPAYKKLSTT